MPNAQVSDIPTRIWLETCPEGYVDLKRMSYGAKLNRQENAFENTAKGSGNNAVMRTQILQREVQYLDFAACIVDHNLTYLDAANGEEVKFNFSNRVWQQLLDPRIGEEIEEHINKMNNYEKVEGSGNLATASN